jgi:DNA-directed RNA polymerase subunit M/transcription elongation factor TFIIS
MKAVLKCPYCDYETPMSMGADINLIQHMRDKHGLSDSEIREALKDFYKAREELAWERFKCPRCGGRELHIKIKCTITADVKGRDVSGWSISRVFYTTLTCNRCSGETVFYDFEDLPTRIKSQIFKL